MNGGSLNLLLISYHFLGAETIAGVIVDPEIRRLVVLWGICILPSISRILGR